MFVPVCQLDDVPMGGMKKVDIGSASVVIYRFEDGVYATQRLCPHTWAPLDRGRLEDGCVICPLHRARFDVRTGEVKEWANWPNAIRLLNPLRGERRLKTYQAKIEDDQIWVDA
ncbi:MAG: non-heme iron oxygenase ferredoxin subunit [Pseudomonadota bacterium]|nr:non-heme iron oxygenase ferredoxin subunit [Pseudomonadota bacterium]